MGKYRSSMIRKWWFWCPTVINPRANTGNSELNITPVRRRASSSKEWNSHRLLSRTLRSSARISSNGRRLAPAFSAKRFSSKPGKAWDKQGRRGGKLLFSESITEYHNQDGVLCVTATSVGVQTEKTVEQ